jgi:hypothetical protein
VAEDITGLLIEWRRGDRDALDKLLPLVDNELRRIARSYFQEDWRDRLGIGRLRLT